MPLVAEIGLRLIGGFYLFAGLVIMRAMAWDHVLDAMLSGITLKPVERKEVLRRRLMVLSGLAVGTGGAALCVLSPWAVPLFLLGLATQAGYLLWARDAFPPEVTAEVTGRRQTINAAILYAAATLGTCWAGATGLLRPWTDPWALAIPAAGLVQVAVVARHFRWRPRPFATTGTPLDDADADLLWPEPQPIPPVHRVRLQQRWGCYPLTDLDTGEDIQPDLYLDQPLAHRIVVWSMAFEDPDDSTGRLRGVFESAADEAAHRAEAADIVRELELVFGPGNAEGPTYPDEIVYRPPVSDGET